MKRLVIDYNPYFTRAALDENGELIEFSVERAAMRGIVGNIYKGKVENVIEGMKAAFVNIGLERNGFLYVGESLVDSGRLGNVREFGGLNVSAGDEIMCQVTKEQLGSKGPRLTTDVTLPGYFMILLPRSGFVGVSRKIEDGSRRTYLEAYIKSICPQNMGFIVRTAADKAGDDDIKLEMQALVSLWEKVQKSYYRSGAKQVVFEDASLFERAIRDFFNEDLDSVVVNSQSVAAQLKDKVGSAVVEVYGGEKNIMTQYGLTEQINALRERKVELENGAYIVIDRTEALTVIDVNTGKFVGSKDLEDTVFKTNLAAAECIAKQLRVRNVSGIVIIDFIDMIDDSHREQVIDALKTALKKDRLKTSSLGMTSLGLVELTRKKTRLPIDSFMLKACEECNGGCVTSDEQLVFMLRDELSDYLERNRDVKIVHARVNPSVVSAVAEYNIMERELESVWKDKQIYLYADSLVKRDSFDVSGGGCGTAAYSGAQRLCVNMRVRDN